MNTTSLFLKTVFPFSSLPEDILISISKKIKIEFFPKGNIILERDVSISSFLYIIYKGKVRLSRGIINKNERLVSFLGRSDFFGELSILSKGEAFFNAIAEEDALCYLLDKAEFLHLIETHNSISDFFTKRITSVSHKALETKRHEIFSKRLLEDSLFLSQVTKSLIQRSPVVCPSNISIQECADVMTVERVGSIVIINDNFSPIGILTDVDIRSKIVSKGISIDKPVSSVMSSPVITVSESIPLLETLLIMAQNKIRHICVLDEKKRLTGIISDNDFTRFQGETPVATVKHIDYKKNAKELSELREQMNKTIDKLVSTNLNVQLIAELIATFNDKLTKRIILLAEEKMTSLGLGPPPVKYAWLSFGSEGRKEQTITTDQDNAILFEDVPENDFQNVQNYFLQLASFVVDDLDTCGFERCKGNIMAINPELCQPLSSWKNKFAKWIKAPNNTSILNGSIFFDLKDLYGDPSLYQSLLAELHDNLTDAKQFFFYMTQNILSVKPPLGFFGSFVVEESGEHKGSFNLKERALRPIVDIARLGALYKKSAETNTWKRFKYLKESNVFSPQLIDNVVEAFSFIMELRFTQHRLDRDSGKTPSNFINPNSLTSISRNALKEAFHIISDIQTEIKYKFGSGIEIPVNM